MLFIILESNLLAVEPGLLFWSFVTFLILFFVLRKIAWKPILEMIEKRENHIRESLERAENAQKKADESLKSYQKMMEESRKESQEIIENGRKTAKIMREEILAKANEESSRLIDRAKKRDWPRKEKSSG